MTTAILARVTVRGQSGYAQQVEIAGHTLAADEPVKRGGTDTGPSPIELLLAGLADKTPVTKIVAAGTTIKSTIETPG
jgi:hypothetical protein